MKKQVNTAAKFSRKAKNVPVKKVINSKPLQSNGKSKTGDKKWASLSLDEFINSSASEDDSSSNDAASADGDEDSDISDVMSNEEEMEEEENEDEEGEIDEEEDGTDDEEDETDDEEMDGDDEDDSSDEFDEKTAVKKHKKTLDKLKNTDPEFYQFLSENDRELLDFDSSDSDDERGGKVHELPKPEELEVGSDESDFEDKESSVKRQGNVITQTMVDQWQQELQNPK